LWALQFIAHPERSYADFLREDIAVVKDHVLCAVAGYETDDPDEHSNALRVFADLMEALGVDEEDERSALPPPRLMPPSSAPP
jgi:hypothetical protein